MVLTVEARDSFFPVECFESKVNGLRFWGVLIPCVHVRFWVISSAGGVYTRSFARVACLGCIINNSLG